MNNNCLSLFSGIGGLDLAAQMAGFNTVAFCENNKFCIDILKKHWPKIPIYEDIRFLDYKKIPKIKLAALKLYKKCVSLKSFCSEIIKST